MFDILEDYAIQDHFFVNPDSDLSAVCNAPRNAVGVYLVYSLHHGEVELVYIGSSGKVLQDGSVRYRVGGLYDRIVNGKQFGEARRRSWKKRMVTEEIDALDVYWYHTMDNEVQDIPSYVESYLLQAHYSLYRRLPRWNKEA